MSVLYAKEAAKEREWATIPDRDKAGRLREVYWANRAESKLGRKAFLRMRLIWRPSRIEIGRRSDDPGDGFIYLVDMMPQVEDRFEWLEVTEVFTTVPAAQIEAAMRARNGIPDKRPVNSDAFPTESTARTPFASTIAKSRGSSDRAGRTEAVEKLVP